MHPLVRISRALSRKLEPLVFGDPVRHVYNPLEYARGPHEAYLERYGSAPKEAVFLGMNPGPFGMGQTGVPFGDVGFARDFLGLGEGEAGRVSRPPDEHPKRPVHGFASTRSEVSGSRLWGWAEERFGTADAFFSRFFVHNYCPLLFLEAGGKNRTPDKLPKAERAALEAACDEALRAMVGALEAPLVIGVGAWAEKRAKLVFAEDEAVSVVRVLHPSPASPKANRGWAAQADAELQSHGITIP